MSKTALITGASKGIGYHLAHLYAQDQYNLILIARHEAELASLANELVTRYLIEVEYACFDLSDAGSPALIYERFKDYSIDSLVNNAGFGLFGRFDETNWELETEMIQCNLTTPLHLTKLFLPQMVARNQGEILNVASIASFVCGPYLSVYYATKAALLSFTESLVSEFHDTDLHIAALCPGPTNTNFEQRAMLDDSKLFKRLSASRAEDVAEVGYRALKRRKSVIIVGRRNQLMIALSRLAPRALLRKIMRQIQERRHES